MIWLAISVLAAWLGALTYLVLFRMGNWKRHVIDPIRRCLRGETLWGEEEEERLERLMRFLEKGIHLIPEDDSPDLAAEGLGSGS